MAEAEKKRRSLALGNFTRSVNILTKLIADNAPIIVVTPKYEKVNETYYKLEAVHEEFIEKTDIDIEEHADGLKYLEKPAETFLNTVNAYSEYFKKIENDEQEKITNKDEADKLLENQRFERENNARIQEEAKSKADETEAKFESTKAEFTSMIDTFNRMNLASKDYLKDVSNDDKRAGLSKLETDFDLLKNKFAQLSGIDPTKDVADLKKKLLDDAETPFLATQK